MNSQRAPEFLASDFTPTPPSTVEGSRKPRPWVGDRNTIAPPIPTALPPLSPRKPHLSLLLPVGNEAVARPGLAGTGRGLRGPDAAHNPLTLRAKGNRKARCQ